MNARHIIWDWNGTLLDDRHNIHSALNCALTAFGHPPLTTAQLVKSFARPLRALFERVTRVVDDDEWEKWHAVFLDAARDLPTAPLAKGARAALTRCLITGREQSIISLAPGELLRRGVEHHGLTGYFQRIAGAGPGDCKVDMIRSFMADLHLGAEELVLIGDTVDDARSAAAVGIRSIICDAVSFEKADAEALAGLGTATAASLDEAVGLAFSGVDVC